ncbi:MAG: hypothetical protein NC331_06200 [Lachnospiraceae bacterium]|nr:hypothetical protein [Lachnospiraceae bacterium]MCM1238961.1 hypothetical protein [Lachnospiraceae bacterium]
MIGKEIYKILSRRIVWLALIVVTAFLIFYDTRIITEEGIIDDGKVYQGREAVAHDRMAAEEFAGPLTFETVQAIWEKYGEPVNLEQIAWEELEKTAEPGQYHNYYNNFVMNMFTGVGEAVPEDGEITLELVEGLSIDNRYLDGSYTFGYVGRGWNWYWDSFFLTLVLVSLVVIIAFCPVFSEDYAFRTADIILPTVKGRFRLWWQRTGSGFLFASAYYWLMSGVLFLFRYRVYGGEGLSVSCGLTFVPYDYMRETEPLWKAVLGLHLCGWFSMLALVLQIQAISSKCKSSFGSQLLSLVAYMSPYAVVNGVLGNLPFTALNKYLQYFCYSMPLTFSGMFVQAPVSGKRVLLTFAVIVAVVAAVLGAWKWGRHQVRS